MIHTGKIGIVAATEFGTAVRSKAFLIGLILLPTLMGGSILIQKYVVDRVDTQPRRFAVIDHTGRLYEDIEQAASANNRDIEGPDGQLTGTPFQPQRVEPKAEPDAEVLVELSNRVRGGELYAFVEIPSDILDAENPVAFKYFSDTPNDDRLRDWLEHEIGDAVRTQRFREAGVDRALTERLSRPIQSENLGLFDREGPEGSGSIRQAEVIDEVRSAAVPAAMMFIMYIVIMTSAPQLMNSVIEEKMSRISEVLLGSVTPFELMMGKLLGNAGLSLVLAAMFVGGVYGFAAYSGYADVVSTRMLAAMVGFLILAVFLFGSLYMAVGSACSELKDAQSLMMPVMLLSIMPVLVWTAVLRNPVSPLSVGMSLFPFGTPFLMLLRIGLQPSPPIWQVGLSVILTTATAIACVWAAGKIFRTGLLMQGKPPSFHELARMVVAK